MSDATSREPLKSVHIVVHGRVQGVNFRAYTARKGRELGLTGWVRNQSDGTVEALAEGSEALLAAFVAFAHVGSPSASVSRVDATWGDASGELSEFHVRYF